MSIARAPAKNPKVLKDLVNVTTRVSIDIKDLKDLRQILTMEIAGDRPPRYDKKTPPFHVGRGPSHATRAGERVPLGWQTVSAL